MNNRRKEVFFDPMAGFCAALAKKVYGSTGTVKQIIENNWKEKN